MIGRLINKAPFTDKFVRRRLEASTEKSNELVCVTSGEFSGSFARCVQPLSDSSSGRILVTVIYNPRAGHVKNRPFFYIKRNQIRLANIDEIPKPGRRKK